MKQIADGLINEAKLQLVLAMGKVSTQKSVLEAQANIAKTWQKLFALSNIEDPNKPLEADFDYDERVPIGLFDSKSPANAVILFIYQMNSFCFKELKRCSSVKDQSKVETLGPLAGALHEIVYCA